MKDIQVDMFLFDKITPEVQKKNIQQLVWEQFSFSVDNVSSFVKAESRQIKCSTLIKMMLQRVTAQCCVSLV